MESKFTGTILESLGVNILCFFICVLSLGIASPWGLCMRTSWYTTHTIIDGKAMTFDGTGIQLFGRHLLWFFLSIITIGIYVFWLPIKKAEWVAKHTHMCELAISAENS